MKTTPIVAAQLQSSPDGVPFAPAFGDIYHPSAGALQQARHVFLGGNGLPKRWAGRDRFVVLETGFGLGNNFLATWAAWRDDPLRCTRLHFVSIERHPPTRADLAAVPRDPALAGLAGDLAANWPPLVHNLHRLVFEDGCVELLLGFGDVAAWLPELVATADAVYLDGFAPARNPDMWQPRLMRALARRAAVGATVSTWSAARPVREALAAAGFVVRLAAGTGGKRDITCAVHAPAFVPRRAPPGRPQCREVEPLALIVGGGLAGCAAARALAELGWHGSVIDRHDAPAREASGNPAGLFHGIVNPQDGTHARWNRAAALQATQAVAQAVAHDGVRGAAIGLLRLADEDVALPGMQATLDRLGLPPQYVQAVDAAEASRLAGIALSRPAWHYPGGGWADPAGLAAAWLRRAQPAFVWRGGVVVDRLRRSGEQWQLLDALGDTIAEAPTIVLANAGDALRLLGHPAWPIERLRGQLSQLAEHDLRAAGGASPRLPVAGAGYLLPALDGQVAFGATSQAADLDTSLRLADHERNLAQLRRLGGWTLNLPAERLQGRVGWRCSSIDRLPLIGAVPAVAVKVASDQPRFVPRQAGLFLFTALGSRGITWAPLGAQLLASWVGGAPSPVEASLLEAVDPARFAAREVRREASLSARSSPVRAA